MNAKVYLTVGCPGCKGVLYRREQGGLCCRAGEACFVSVSAAVFEDVTVELKPFQGSVEPEAPYVYLTRELGAYLDSLNITSENIGDLRRACFLPWDTKWNAIVRDETARREKAAVVDAPSGYCPVCSRPGVSRERRPDGDDACEAGHTYPSRSAKKTADEVPWPDTSRRTEGAPPAS